MVQNYHTTRDAARLLGVSLRTVQLWLDKDYLQGWRTSGGHRRIQRSSLMQVLRERRKSVPRARVQDTLQVLVAEDNLALLKLYRTQISRWPFPVELTTAPDGYEALVMVGMVAPDLLVCDLRLPGVTGFQVVRAVCEMQRYRETVIVVVSGLPAAEIEAHGNLPARIEQIGKPIDFARLQEIADSIWARRAAKRRPAKAVPAGGSVE